MEIASWVCMIVAMLALSTALVMALLVGRSDQKLTIGHFKGVYAATTIGLTVATVGSTLYPHLWLSKIFAVIFGVAAITSAAAFQSAKYPHQDAKETS